MAVSGLWTAAHVPGLFWLLSPEAGRQTVVHVHDTFLPAMALLMQQSASAACIHIFGSRPSARSVAKIVSMPDVRPLRYLKRLELPWIPYLGHSKINFCLPQVVKVALLESSIMCVGRILYGSLSVPVFLGPWPALCAAFLTNDREAVSMAAHWIKETCRAK